MTFGKSKSKRELPHPEMLADAIALRLQSVQHYEPQPTYQSDFGDKEFCHLGM
jgi:hypothetical protein